MTKPIYTLLMFKGHGAINFCELDADEWRFCDEHPQQYQIFIIDGQHVKILVATEDFTQTRAEALKTASTFVFGRYQKVEVDLKRLIGTVTNGIPIIHPPY